MPNEVPNSFDARRYGLHNLDGVEELFCNSLNTSSKTVSQTPALIKLYCFACSMNCLLACRSCFATVTFGATCMRGMLIEQGMDSLPIEREREV